MDLKDIEDRTRYGYFFAVVETVDKGISHWACDVRESLTVLGVLMRVLIHIWRSTREESSVSCR
ncbi:hypothetical protein PISMIDRAFT_681423 [Pisolithus microcarpus 441]|uniref:Uncharacterized protein n=1 Tax=Pisolithus microcarpus 441 TaxID=765257 RepID=A0A0C9ZG52_9AGAM|nr:hypothetical protein PISMIDRAFT_681423 [Pisolithus microcarpus 441]